MYMDGLVQDPESCCNIGHPFETHINTLWQRQNGRDFANNIIKCIFVNENAHILIKFHWSLFPRVKINNIPALVQIMAWRPPGENHYLNQYCLVYWCIYVSLGLKELNSNLVKFCLIITSILVLQSFWNSAQSMASSLPISKWNLGNAT